MRSSALVYLTISLLLIASIPTGGAITKDSKSTWTDLTVSGGQSLLVEELTATWCSSCTEIDPYLHQVADSHGSRISIVSYHPTDDVDAFQPQASKLRIERLELKHPEIGQTPSFVVESSDLRVGPESWPDVQKDILREETSRQSYSRLNFSISQENLTYTAKVSSSELLATDEKTELSFLLLEHKKEVPEGEINPGGKYRDRVTVGYASCDLTNNSVTRNVGFLTANASSCGEDFTVTFGYVSQFSLILIHEYTIEEINDNPRIYQTLGVVEFSYREVYVEDNANYATEIFIAFITLGIIWSVLARKFPK